jgi:hypothetical protein
MSYFDKELACRDCGAGFTFTAGQQEFFSPLLWSPLLPCA